MFESTLIVSSSNCNAPLSVDEKNALKELGIATAEKPEEARVYIDKENRFATFLVTGNDLTPEVDKHLRYCADRLCTLTDFQFIVCDDPSIRLQILAHELGFRNFWPRETLVAKIRSWASEQLDILNDPSHPTAISIRLCLSIAQRKYKDITEMFDTVSEEARYDFRIANVLGHYHTARKEHDKAELAFASAHEQNPTFLPSLNSLAVAQLNAGKAELAVGTFKKLEGMNDSNPERKNFLAQACADLGLWLEAKKFAETAEKIDPGNSKSKEVRARCLFQEGKTDEAINLLNTCDTTNEYYISKLNDEAIKLSRANLIDKAIQLYETAYRISPQHLKYKLSFNIALALRRKGDPRKALAFAERAQQECKIPNFDKVNLLVETLEQEMEGK